ncbi:hypothetical protein E8E13_004993 [Curvularia kusanoi]|uniref:Uncharacterized protein n=1 Tax=Curvularia kusanoi TaxID=90978 RepID=A0A9P4WBD7_CURKU|nr:hypothetical protein E8E13_004993 [Curvularia kusanoi]
MAATAGAFTNMTSFLPSPSDLLMVFPRLFDKVSSYGDVIRSGGSVIAEPTMANVTNSTIATTAGKFAQESVAAAAAASSGATDEISMFQAFKNVASFFSYMTSKWAIATFAIAILLNRTQFYASSRVPLSFDRMYVRLALYIAPLLLFTLQNLNMVRAIRCQTSPEWSEMQYGTPNRWLGTDFSGEGGYLYRAASGFLFWENTLDSCKAVGMLPDAVDETRNNGSLALLWPLFLSLGFGQFVETLACALQGRPPVQEVGMTIFEHSLAFAEAEAVVTKPLTIDSARFYQPKNVLVPNGTTVVVSRSGLNSIANVPPEVLLISLISSISHWTSNLLAVAGIRSRYRLITTAIWGVAYMATFVWSFLRLTEAIAESDNPVGLLRFPTVCIIGFIPHLLIIIGTTACGLIYLLALFITVLVPPPGQSETMTWKERFEAAYNNLHANIHLSSIAPLTINWHEDFYTAILKVGFTVLTAASEAVFLNEGIRINVHPMTFLEKQRLKEVLDRRRQYRQTLMNIPEELTGATLAPGVGTEDKANGDASMEAVTSGYARERKTRNMNAVPGNASAGAQGDPAGLQQRRGRFFLTWQFFKGIAKLLMLIHARLTIAMLQRMRVGYRPRWLRRLAGPRPPKDARVPSRAFSDRQRRAASVDAWLTLDDRSRVRLDEQFDAEAFAKDRLRQIGFLDAPSSEQSEDRVDEYMYSWWRNGGRFGDVDNSSDYVAPLDDDTTSVLSYATTDVDEWSDEEEDGQRTPTRDTYQRSRESTPAVENALDLSRLSVLLDPRTKEDREEAKLLSRHLQSPQIMTRSQYRKTLDQEQAKILTTSRYRLETSAGMTAEEEEQLLEDLILDKRQATAPQGSSGGAGSWDTGAEVELRNFSKLMQVVGAPFTPHTLVAMGKRTNFEGDAGGAHASKRQRVEAGHERNSPRPNGAGAEEMHSARDLQKALYFDQNATNDFRNGLSSFKRFLDSILYPTDEHDVPRRRAILREYLDTQKGKSQDEKHETLLPTLIQAWDWAAETNFDAILAQVTAVLALLFKVLGSHAELTAYGTTLAKTILQPSVARRLVRSTSAASNKENVISPALRLLTELTRFNEGAHARAVYSKKDFTLEPRILGRNIALWKEHKGMSVADMHKKPSVRTTAIRYLLTHLRLQDERAKVEILSNTNVTRAVFDHLSTDPPFLIFEIFDVFTNHVFRDKTVPRQTKSRILNGKTLSRIAGLYNYDLEEGSLSEGHRAPEELAHDFLCMVCTDPAYGVMLPTNGLYPSTHDDEDGDMDEAADNGNDLGLDSAETFDRLGRVRNVILSEFIQSQRPYANTSHQKLVIEIFKASPELVADYFIKRRDFNYDPNLTSTWIGYSAFLFQTIQLPVPKYFGVKKSYRNQPPPVAAMIQSVLPQPLNQQVLTKCLNHSSDLVQTFAIRVLIAALQKLRSMVHELNEGNAFRPSKQWEQASQRLVSEFSRRCPIIRTVFLALKKPGLQNMKRESITRLLRLYYEVTPQAALQEKFDVSLPLCNALVEVEKPTGSPEDTAFRVMELEHWIQMARHSPAMRWWQKPKTLQHSPFVTLLKLLVTSKENELYTGVKSLLNAVLQDQDMLQTRTSPDALDALIASLEPSAGSVPSTDVLDFVDDCCARFIKVPIKYFDDVDAMCAKASIVRADTGPFSPLLMTFVEQWPFKGGESATGPAAEALAGWLSKVLYLFNLIGEDEAVLTLVRDSLIESAGKTYKEVLKDAFLWKMYKARAKEALKLATGADFSGSERSSASPVPQAEAEAPAKTGPQVDLEIPPQEDEKHNGLIRWRKKEVEEAIEDGDIGELLLCLCSKHQEIRIQAINNVRQLMASIGADSLTQDLGAVYLLLGETLESLDPSGAKPFPYVGGVFAARSVRVLADPTHVMFSKINKFLTAAPAWNVDFLASKLYRSIVGSEPDDDGTYHREVEWFLDYLIDGLRTARDMESFRKSNIFEQLLSFYASRSCSAASKEKILRLLLRATAVGGSTTLITRCGLASWIQMCLGNQDPRQKVLRVLAARAYETCDQGRVAEWSNGTIDASTGSLVKTKG